MLLKLKTNTNVQKIIKLKFNIADRRETKQVDTTESIEMESAFLFWP